MLAAEQILSSVNAVGLKAAQYCPFRGSSAKINIKEMEAIRKCKIFCYLVLLFGEAPASCVDGGCEK